MNLFSIWVCTWWEIFILQSSKPCKWLIFIIIITDFIAYYRPLPPQITHITFYIKIIIKRIFTAFITNSKVCTTHWTNVLDLSTALNKHTFKTKQTKYKFCLKKFDYNHCSKCERLFLAYKCFILFLFSLDGLI